MAFLLVHSRRSSCGSHMNLFDCLQVQFLLVNFTPVKSSAAHGSEPKVSSPNLWLSFCSSFTLLLGVLGNAMILWAVLGFREMKSPTNIFLASLAFADLLLCSLCLPVKVKNYGWCSGGKRMPTFCHMGSNTIIKNLMFISSSVSCLGLWIEPMPAAHSVPRWSPILLLFGPQSLIVWAN